MGDRELRPIGRVEDFPEGSCRFIEIGKHRVGIYNVGGSFYAIRNFCPHMGAPVCMGTVSGAMLPSAVGEYHWGLEGHVLRCPWHQWTFDIRTGRALFGIDRSRLVTHTVVRDGDELYIDERIRKASEIEDLGRDGLNGTTPQNGAAMTTTTTERAPTT